MRYGSYQGFGIGPLFFLIMVNLLVFIMAYLFLRTISSEAYLKLLFLFGLQPADFLSRPWTILTSMFLHAGFWHIFANMFTLYFFGSYLSRLVGEGKFLLVYFGGGILGSLLFILLAPPFAVGVGASGAIFGVGGALTMMRPKLPVIVFPIPVPVPLWVAVIGGFVILSFLPYVAWQAHLGGLVFGLIAGYFFRRRERRVFF